MTDNDFYEDDEPVEDVRAAFEAGEKGLTRRPRLDSVHSTRFTPEQVDQIRAHIGDGSVSAFVRDAVMAAIHPPQPLRTYRCRHLSISGRFNERPGCGQGCMMTEQPITQTTWGTPTITMNFGPSAAA